MTEPTPDTPGARLRMARQSMGLSGEEFGEHLGVTKAAVSGWETNKTGLPKAFALAIEHVFGISFQWITEGTGDWWDRSGNLRPLDVLTRPLLEGAPECGPGGQILDPGTGARLLSFPFDVALDVLSATGGGNIDDLFFVEVKGDSMVPTLIGGDIVLVNTAVGIRLEPRSGGIHLVRRRPEDEDIRVKRVRLDSDRHQLVLSSDNRSFAPAILDLDGIPLHQVVLGRVCWVGRYLLDTDPPKGDW